MKKLILMLVLSGLMIVGCGGGSSSNETPSEVAGVDTIAPNKPTLTANTPMKTTEDSQTIELNGEVGATIWVNSKKIGTIGENGKATITLDTSGVEGSKSFSIILKDPSDNASNALIISIERTTVVIVDTTANYFVSVDNSLHDVNATFKTFNIVVYTDTELANEPSNSTKALYGNINGESTNALLKLNSNYLDGTAFIVKVFKGAKLVGESDKAILSSGTLEFSDIATEG